MKKNFPPFSKIWLFFALGLILILPAHAALTTKNIMPELLGLTAWQNTTKPLTRKDLAGKVILLDFWDYGDTVSLRKIKVLKRWHKQLSGKPFVIIGIQTPHYGFSKSAENFARAVSKLHIPYAVALDPDATLWKLFNNLSFPVHYLMDAEGNVRYSFYGEDQFAETEKRIKELIFEKSGQRAQIPRHPDFDKAGLATLPFNFGYSKINRLGNAESLKADIQSYKLPENLTPDSVYLSGSWESKEENLIAAQPESSLVLVSHGTFFYTLMGSSLTKPITVEVLLNGQPLTLENAGRDIKFEEGKSTIPVLEHRIYRLVNLSPDQRDMRIDIIAKDAGLEVYEASFA